MSTDEELLESATEDKLRWLVTFWRLVRKELLRQPQPGDETAAAHAERAYFLVMKTFTERNYISGFFDENEVALDPDTLQAVRRGKVDILGRIYS